MGSDELWLFHQGECLEIHLITKAGTIETRVLGNRLAKNEEPQIAIPANVWFAAGLKSGEGFSLVSCVVAPGFDFEDFELADKDELIKLYPDLEDEIDAFSLKAHSFCKLKIVIFEINMFLFRTRFLSH